MYDMHAGRGRKRVPSPLEQQSQVVVAMFVLRTEPRTSETQATALPSAPLQPILGSTLM